jgi:chromosome partitioning protein
MQDVILPTPVENLWIAPSRIALAKLEARLVGEMDAHFRLKDKLEPLLADYPNVVIDCPPTLGLLTINSLVAASRVIIPVQTQYDAIKGLTALIKVINTIKLKLNHDLEILGLLATFYDGRTVLAREMLQNLRELGDHRVFNTMIKNTVKLGEAPLTGKPVTEYATNSAAARAFRDLAQEVIELG